MISTNFAVSAAAVQPQAPPASPNSAHSQSAHSLLPTISSVASLVTSDQQAALVKKLNHTNHNSNSSSEKNKMTNFSIAAIMNNERGSSGLVRPMPASETKLGKSYYFINIYLKAYWLAFHPVKKCSSIYLRTTINILYFVDHSF